MPSVCVYSPPRIILSLHVSGPRLNLHCLVKAVLASSRQQPPSDATTSSNAASPSPASASGPENLLAGSSASELGTIVIIDDDEDNGTSKKSPTSHSTPKATTPSTLKRAPPRDAESGRPKKEAKMGGLDAWLRGPANVSTPVKTATAANPMGHDLRPAPPVEGGCVTELQSYLCSLPTDLKDPSLDAAIQLRFTCAGQFRAMIVSGGAARLRTRCWIAAEVLP